MSYIFYRNVNSQRWKVFVFNSNQDGVEGERLNITAKLRKDSGSLVNLTLNTPFELANGYYDFVLAEEESDAAKLELFPEISTPGLYIIPVPATIFTTPGTFKAW